MSACAIYPDLDAMRRSTFCGTPLGDYTHDELVQLVHEAIRFRQGDLGALVHMASAFNARRRADVDVKAMPFITRRKGGGHDTAAR